jgi:Tol biopolymer transport system component
MRVVAVLLITAGLAACSASGRTTAISSPPGAARTQSIRSAIAGDTTDTTHTTDAPDPPTTTKTTVAPEPGATTTLPRATTTLPGAPPTTSPHPATTTTVPSVAPTGPPTGRVLLTLGIRTGTSSSSVGGGIATMAPGGGDIHVLVPGQYDAPEWTPDGRFVVFGSAGAFGIWAMPAGGGPITKLADGVGAAISPDGTKIVYSHAVSFSTATPAMLVQPISETAAGLVPSGPATPLGIDGESPVWSPDGSHLLYNSDFGVKTDLSIAGADGSDPHQLLAATPVRHMATDQADFSADGQTISFLGMDSTLYFIGADGSDLRAVVTGVFNTAWSPDHTTLAALFDGARSVIVVDVGRHVLASFHLTPPSYPGPGLALDGSGHER